MSVWATIARIPAALYDETIAVEQVVGRDWVPVVGMDALRCTFEPIGGGSRMLLFALNTGATHHVRLATHQPAIQRGMRVVRGGEHYPIIQVENHDGQVTDLICKSTAATG